MKCPCHVEGIKGCVWKQLFRSHSVGRTDIRGALEKLLKIFHSKRDK
jgi:hypothetical protein